ncbi:MAG: YciI family protein [Thermoplasmata archaeon]|nr:YciI family protein [Thermoplasmata archaeon]
MSGEPPSDPTPPTETEKLPATTRYVLGLLRRAPNRPAVSEEEAERIQEGHLAHIRRLEKAGKIIVSGPFEGDGDLRGVLIFSASSFDDVRGLTESDPALMNGRLVLNLYTWVAPAGLRIGPPRAVPVDDPDMGTGSDPLPPL